jgi:hypothetical protein
MRAVANPAARFTVVEFFSAHCPCQAVHDARLAVLARTYGPRGVTFVAVDSEADASLERDQREAEQRGYPYPILLDPEGSIARALHADYATYTVLLDARQQILFRGGIDGDRTHLHADATPYLKNALDDALAGRPIQVPEAKTLGCSLMLE